MSAVQQSNPDWPTVHQPLDRSHVQLLLALRDTGRLALAAETLSITASAASHRLREAERRVGTELAVPDGRSLRLTTAGRHLADAAAVSEATLRSAEDTARWLGAGSSPRVRLAVDFYDTTPWIAMLLGNPHPEIGVSAVRVRYEAGPEAVERRSVDITIDPSPIAAGVSRPLAVDELAAVVGSDHPAAERGELTVDDVVNAVYLTAGHTPRSGFEHHEFMAPAGALPGSLVRIESVSQILHLVAGGHGITVQPRLALGPAEPLGLAVIPLRDVAIGVRWDITTRAEDDPITWAIVDRLRQLVDERATLGSPPEHWSSQVTDG